MAFWPTGRPKITCHSFTEAPVKRASGKETIVEPPGTLSRTQEPLRCRPNVRNRYESPGYCFIWPRWGCMPSESIGLDFGCMLYWGRISLGPNDHSFSFWTTDLGFLRYFWFCNCSLSETFVVLEILLEYCIEQVTIRLLYVKFVLSTMIFYSGVPGIVTDCLWLIPLINHLPLYTSPHYGNTILNKSWFVS